MRSSTRGGEVTLDHRSAAFSSSMRYRPTRFGLSMPVARSRQDRKVLSRTVSPRSSLEDHLGNIASDGVRQIVPAWRSYSSRMSVGMHGDEPSPAKVEWLRSLCS